MKLLLGIELIIIISLQFLQFSDCSGTSNKKQETAKKKHDKKEKHDSKKRDTSSPESHSNSKAVHVNKVGTYKMIYVEKETTDKQFLQENHLLKTSGTRTKSGMKSKNHQHKNKNTTDSEAVDTFFNDFNDNSDVSSVDDELPKTRTDLNERNANSSDFTSYSRVRSLPYLSNTLNEIPNPDEYDSDPDILAKKVKNADFQTSHSSCYDCFSTMSDKETNPETFRHPNIHDHRSYNRNNEVDPTVPFNKKNSVTSQKYFHSVDGRVVGRDGKVKNFSNSDTHDSINDACTIQ